MLLLCSFGDFPSRNHTYLCSALCGPLCPRFGEGRMHSKILLLCKRHPCLPVRVFGFFPLQGIHQVLRFAGKAWVFERELASQQEIESYWETAAPIWKARMRASRVSRVGVKFPS